MPDLETKTIYIDASFDPKTQVAIGGYLLEGSSRTRVITDSNNTCAEIITAIWALKSVNFRRISVYTDCQGIIQLLSRRDRLQANNFWSKRSSRELAHSELYREFFSVVDYYEPLFIKVKGHVRAPRSEQQQMFAQIDRLVRAELREFLKTKNL